MIRRLMALPKRRRSSPCLDGPGGGRDARSCTSPRRSWARSWLPSSFSGRTRDALRDAKVDLLMNVHSLSSFIRRCWRPANRQLQPPPRPASPVRGPQRAELGDFEGARDVGDVDWMDAGVDTGPIAWQSDSRSPTDTGLAVAGKCVRLGVPASQTGDSGPTDPGPIPASSETGADASTSAGPPAEGRIDWAQPAEQSQVRPNSRLCAVSLAVGSPAGRTLGRVVGVARGGGDGAPAALPPGDHRGGRLGCARCGGRRADRRRAAVAGRPLSQAEGTAGWTRVSARGHVLDRASPLGNRFRSPLAEAFAPPTHARAPGDRQLVWNAVARQRAAAAGGGRDCPVLWHLACGSPDALSQQ